MKILLGIAFMAAALPLRADSVMFKGDSARSGFARGIFGGAGASAGRLSPTAGLAWKAEAGGEFYSSPAIKDGIVYLGNSDHHIYAYDLKDGKLLWVAELGERIYGAGPQLEGGKLYTTCVDACVYVLDSKTGKELSKYCLPEPGFFSAGNDVLGSPLVLGKRLFFGSDDGSLYALGLPDFKPLWSFKSENKFHDSAPVFDGKALYAASVDGRVYALDPETGALLWKSQSYNTLNTTPLAFNDRLYFGSKDGKIRALEAKTGALAWEFRTERGVMASPSLHPDLGLVIVGSGDSFVYALSAKDGSLKWKFKTGGAVLAPALVTDQAAWVGSFDGYFYLLSLKDGAELFKHEAKGGIFAAPAAAGGKVVVGSRAGALYCFQATIN